MGFIQRFEAARAEETCVVSEVSTLLVITQDSSFKKFNFQKFMKYNYLNAKVASLATIKSCVTVGLICWMANVWPCAIVVD